MRRIIVEVDDQLAEVWQNSLNEAAFFLLGRT